MSQHPNESERKSPRQRMGGGPPAPGAPREVSAGHDVTADSVETQHETSVAPRRRQRMGSPVGDAAPTGPTSGTQPAVRARQRMGSGKTTEVSDTSEAMSAGETPAAPVVQRPARQRMGGQATNTIKSSEPLAQMPRHSMGAAETAKTHDGPVETPAPEASPRRRMGKPLTPATENIKPPVVAGQSGVNETAKPEAAPSLFENRKKQILIAAGVLVLAVAVVLLCRWWRNSEAGLAFLEQFPGAATTPSASPEGIPGWLGWQHFLNMFFMVLIVKTGLQVRREQRPAAHWTPNPNSFFSPKHATAKKVSISQWLHQALDVLWMANGVVFVVLLFVTGHWMRIVPTGWEIFPNMLSAAIQYGSLNWPVEHSWVHYNALQMVAYFLTVFVAAPLAAISGVRFSTWWPDKKDKLNRIYPVEIARKVHFPVMIYFVLFTIVHVGLVFFTGVLRNLNHMYTSRDVVDWIGLLVFLGSLVLIVAAWFLSRPMFIAPIANLMGKVSK